MNMEINIIHPAQKKLPIKRVSFTLKLHFVKYK